MEYEKIPPEDMIELSKSSALLAFNLLPEQRLALLKAVWALGFASGGIAALNDLRRLRNATREAQDSH